MTLGHAAPLASNTAEKRRALLLGVLILTASCSVSCATLSGSPARTPAILVKNFGRSMSGYALDPSGRVTSTGTLSYSMAEVDDATDAKVDSTAKIYVANSSILNEQIKTVSSFFLRVALARRHRSQRSRATPRASMDTLLRSPWMQMEIFLLGT